MKYLVTATEPSLDAKIHKRFGHASYYLIVDPETMEFSAIRGGGEKEPFRGLDSFQGMNIGRIIVGNIGPGAFTNCANFGWTVYSCHGMKVREAVEKVKNDLVPPITTSTLKISVSSAQGKRHYKHKDH
ncbi:MAG: NifB/NifX family molybdenum-iron cluster-binding protein [Candidatus Hatepunaea meridiana]|nr:NifB/NifX family molybdenum-iron cluster-binding protein [Candidatus Hatepunaea meridiana]